MKIRWERLGVLTTIMLLITIVGMSWIQDYIRQDVWFTFSHPTPLTMNLHGVGPVLVNDYHRLGTWEIQRPSVVGKNFFSSHNIFRELFYPTHAQIGLTSIGFNISSQTCTQILTGTTTTKIFLYSGLFAINANGTGQTVTLIPGLTNGTGTTCGTNALVNSSTSSVGTFTVQSTGTSASATTVVQLNPGAPAIILPTSSALDVTTATASITTGYVTLAQQ